MSADKLDRAAQKELEALLLRDPATASAILDGVRRHLGDFRYQPGSVLFELFQNADDACVQRGDAPGAVAVEVGGGVLRLAHDGRGVNRVPAGAPAGHRYDRDLANMIYFNHSDKQDAGPEPAAAPAVTGRFGLGFKSVHLVSDEPRVVSGRLAFKVVGGVFPVPLDQASSLALRAWLTGRHFDGETATAVELPLNGGVDVAELAGRFVRLAQLLTVFARRVRAIRCHTPAGERTAAWRATTTHDFDGGTVEVGRLDPDGMHGLPREALVVRTAAGDVGFGLDSSGFVRVADDVPTVWVTAPTGEVHRAGFLVNAPLKLDVGRVNVEWDAPETSRASANWRRTLARASSPSSTSSLPESLACPRRRTRPSSGPPSSPLSPRFTASRPRYATCCGTRKRGL